MAADYIILPYFWRRLLAAARVALGLACGWAYIHYPGFGGPLMPMLYGIYVGWGVGVLLFRAWEQLSYELPGLLIDAAFFVLCALHPSPAVLWLSVTFYFYLLLTGVLLREWMTIGYLALACSLFVLIIRPVQWAQAWPLVILAGVLAVVSGLLKGLFQQRLSAAFRRSVLSRSDAETARTTERDRIAADFHDGPLQSFISFQMRLEIIRRLLARKPEAALQELEQLQEICKNQVTEMRAFVRSMRPTGVDASNWNTSLRQLVKAFENDSGIFVNVQSREVQGPADPEIALELLQIIREALHNVQKHSRASRIALSMTNIDERLEITIEDDGSGFPFSGMYSLEEMELLRLGPVSIRRRVRGLNGDLTVDSRPGRGATLRVRVPV